MVARQLDRFVHRACRSAARGAACREQAERHRNREPKVIHARKLTRHHGEKPFSPPRKSVIFRCPHPFAISPHASKKERELWRRFGRSECSGPARWAEGL